MNNIEKQASFVLDMLAEKIIYVFDPSESCGYEVEQQIQLLNRIKKRIDKPIILVANKMDLDTTKFGVIRRLYPEIIELSVKEDVGLDKIKKAL